MFSKFLRYVCSPKGTNNWNRNQNIFLFNFPHLFSTHISSSNNSWQQSFMTRIISRHFQISCSLILIRWSPWKYSEILFINILYSTKHLFILWFINFFIKFSVKCIIFLLNFIYYIIIIIFNSSYNLESKIFKGKICYCDWILPWSWNSKFRKCKCNITEHHLFIRFSFFLAYFTCFLWLDIDDHRLFNKNKNVHITEKINQL